MCRLQATAHLCVMGEARTSTPKLSCHCCLGCGAVKTWEWSKGCGRGWKGYLHPTTDMLCSSSNRAPSERERNEEHTHCSKGLSSLHLHITSRTPHTSAWLTDSTSFNFTSTEWGAAQEETEEISGTMKAMDTLWPFRRSISSQLLCCPLLTLNWRAEMPWSPGKHAAKLGISVWEFIRETKTLVD